MNRFPEIRKNFGFGFMRLPMKEGRVDIATTTEMVDTFLARGFNYFDTAHGYIDGQSETALRQCLTSRYARDRYVLTNKLSDFYFETEAEILPLFEAQLAACGVEYFDFYLMHAMNAQRHEKYQKTHAYDVAAALKAQGRIRHMGISFHDSAEVLDRILTDRPEIEVVQLQFNYVDYEDPEVQSRACYEVCRKHDKPVIVMEPVKGGSLVNLPPEALALLEGGSPASYAIRFAAGFEGIRMVLSGMSDLAQMEDNTGFMADFRPLSEAEQETVSRVRAIYQSRHRIPCTACRYCTEVCPMGIPIPELFAGMNAHWETGAVLSPEPLEAASACVRCGRCAAACPQHLRIPELLAQIRENMAEPSIF